MPCTAKTTSPTASPEPCEAEASGGIELSPSMAKAFQQITETISKTISAKLDPLA